MCIGVYIPSLNRPYELERCVGTLNAQGYPYELLIDPQTKPQCLHKLVNRGVATLKAKGAMGIVVLADHIVVQPNFFMNLERHLRRGGLDRMYGFNLENVVQTAGVTEYSFFCVGSKFTERFPDSKIFCPDYYHFFSDTELGMYATKNGLFTYCSDVRVKTYHPNAKNKESDATHKASRKFKSEENAIWAKRRKKNLLWGETEELIGEGSWR